MALTAPTPPTPPTPPSAPKITFGGGGSVTETTKPQGHGPMTDDALHEQQAREAVANGSGPLSKTTINHGKNENAPDKQTSEPAQPSRPVTQNIPPAGGATRQPAIQQGNQNLPSPLLDERNDMPVQRETVTKPPESYHAHGMLYWGGILIAILLIVVVVLRTVLFRKEDGNTSVPADTEIRPKAGMTAAEVLQEIETGQRMTPAPHVAREYAAQSATPPRAKNTQKSAPRPTRQGKKEDEKRERFEIRI